MINDIRDYYHFLSDDQRHQFCRSIGVGQRYLEYNLLGNAPEKQRRMPSPDLIRKMHLATGGTVPVLGVLVTFWPEIRAEFKAAVARGEAERNAARDQSAAAPPRNDTDQDAAIGDQDRMKASVESTDQSAHGG